MLAVPEKFSQEKVTLMEALGAEVVRTPHADGMEGAIRYVKERAAKTPNSMVAGQFENQANPDFHYETTARELYEQMGGQIDAVVIGSGTGGTFTGVARYLKERNPRALAIVIETQGSVLGGGPRGEHEVEGIAQASFQGLATSPSRTRLSPFAIATPSRWWGCWRDGGSPRRVERRRSRVWRRRNRAKTGPGKRVATIIPDSAERYLSKDIFHFNEKH